MLCSVHGVSGFCVFGFALLHPEERQKGRHWYFQCIPSRFQKISQYRWTKSWTSWHIRKRSNYCILLYLCNDWDLLYQLVRWILPIHRIFFSIRPSKAWQHPSFLISHGQKLLRHHCILAEVVLEFEMNI